MIIGPESDHCLPLSLTDWLTDSCLVNLIDVFLACEDSNSKLVDVVTVADEHRFGNNLLQISKQRFGKKAKLLFRLWAQGLVKILKLKFRQDLKLEFGQFFFCWFFVEVMKLNLGRYSEARFGQDFEAYVLWRGWYLVEIWSWCLVEILKMKFDQDLCLNLWYELNPRVRCAFGNVLSLLTGSSYEVMRLCTGSV